MLLAATACGSADSPADEPGDLRAVRSLKVDYTGDTLVARVRTEVLAEKSRILLKYAWVEGGAFHVGAGSEPPRGKPVATGLWVNNSEEFAGRIGRDVTDVQWDEKTRTVIFTFTRPEELRPGSVAEVSVPASRRDGVRLGPGSRRKRQRRRSDHPRLCGEQARHPALLTPTRRLSG